MADPWDLWRTASAGVAAVLVVMLLVRYSLEAYLRRPVRRLLDLVAAPLFALFAAFILSDFVLRPVP